MPGERAARDSARDPLDQALADEIERIDLLTSRLWRVLTLLGVLGSLVVAFTVDLALGLWCALAFTVMLVWFSAAVALLERKRARPLVSVLSTLIESAIPWAVLMMLIAVQGARYALGSWLPPMLFGALIVAATVRLRPTASLVIGLSGGAAFTALYFGLARGALPHLAVDEPLYRASTQITRAISLVIGGVLGMLMSRGLRNVIGRAESSARAQDLFGKYRVIRQVASGGMGTVHEALYCPEGGFERRVAIKRIHPHLAEQESFVQAFRVEAELCARLVQSNIVQVFDFGRVSDTYFLAMEYVDGLTLLSFIRRINAARHSLNAGFVAYLGRQMLAGLAYSHGEALGSDGRPLRVIHRDLSPANVLLSRNGEVKISDFGVARALRDAASTRTRTVAGHAGYMAPEQALALPLDERCDLFGLGVMLWELLAGRRLFQRENETATLYALMSEPIPPITAIRPELDARWDSFLERALARTASERFGSAIEMAAALDLIESPAGRSDTETAVALIEKSLALPERSAGPIDRETLLDHQGGATQA